MGIEIRGYSLVRTKGTEDIFNQVRSKVARKTCPEGIWPVAPSQALSRDPSRNELEALKGDRKGQHSIRINEQYRVCFRWAQDGPEDVEITDYH